MFLAKECAQYWLTERTKPAQYVWLGKLTELHMIPLDWLGHKTSTQINKCGNYAQISLHSSKLQSFLRYFWVFFVLFFFLEYVKFYWYFTRYKLLPQDPSFSWSKQHIFTNKINLMKSISLIYVHCHHYHSVYFFFRQQYIYYSTYFLVLVWFGVHRPIQHYWNHVEPILFGLNRIYCLYLYRSSLRGMGYFQVKCLWYGNIYLILIGAKLKGKNLLQK